MTAEGERGVEHSVGLHQLGLASTAINGRIDATPSISKNAITRIMPISAPARLRSGGVNRKRSFLSVCI